MSGRLLVIQHEDDAPAAWFGEWVEASGVRLSVVLGHRGDAVPSGLAGYDALLVLGGAMGAYDVEQHPWLTPTRQLIRDTVREGGKPFLGICLGHQLAAVALGGTVTRNPSGRTLGLVPITLTRQATADPLFARIPTGARAVHWNDDVVTQLPAHAATLAEAPDGSVQAARFGLRAWGVQFHPEVSPTVFSSWGRAVDPSEPSGPDPQTLRSVADQITVAEPELRASWRPLAERFAALVAPPRRASARATS